MSVRGEGKTPKNERETKTILNIELLFARVDLMRTRTHGKKALLQSLWWSYIPLGSGTRVASRKRSKRQLT